MFGGVGWETLVEVMSVWSAHKVQITVCVCVCVNNGNHSCSASSKWVMTLRFHAAECSRAPAGGRSAFYLLRSLSDRGPRTTANTWTRRCTDTHTHTRKRTHTCSLIYYLHDTVRYLLHPLLWYLDHFHKQLRRGVSVRKPRTLRRWNAVFHTQAWLVQEYLASNDTHP